MLGCIGKALEEKKLQEKLRLEKEEKERKLRLKEDNKEEKEMDYELKSIRDHYLGKSILSYVCRYVAISLHITYTCTYNTYITYTHHYLYITCIIYLSGQVEKKRKVIKPSEKFQRIFQFDWEQDDDTTKDDMNPLYAHRMKINTLFGRGYLAGEALSYTLI